ncbi:hypothetical protein E2C01_011452 [Portunus trituberculatus]|uniref:Uncharacterized protein n=1 Tax=Portunus trituberculatus TaxID=210409 RepID=A0A5B7DB43_PORTR|nr:hypothetical protein [Portunus trituberculatus]
MVTTTSITTTFSRTALESLVAPQVSRELERSPPRPRPDNTPLIKTRGACSCKAIRAEGLSCVPEAPPCSRLPCILRCPTRCFHPGSATPSPANL